MPEAFRIRWAGMFGSSLPVRRAYLTGVFGFLAEEGNLTVGDDGAVRDVLADDGGAFVEVHEYKNPFV